ncbi:MAG: hypothetical protein MJE66_09600 [Proteobacteria bacterium]|nr:hypothetical protein [Pseudomonadota bacterium]
MSEATGAETQAEASRPEDVRPEEVLPEEWALIRRSVARLRESVLAVSFAGVGGAGLWLATAWLVAQGGDPVGPHLGLLANYFPGYRVTWAGSFVGFGYGALTGAILGWSIGRLYNWIALRREPN